MAPPITETMVVDEDVDLPVTVVEVATDSAAPSRHVLAGPSLSVGTGEECDIQLRDPTVSRLHCTLVREGGQLRLRDLGSKNGCWLAGARVYDLVLGPDVRVRVGNTTLTAGVSRRKIRAPAWKGGDRFGPLLGPSAAMQRTFALAARSAATAEPVLIRGESGTGKELLARAIHDASERRDGPFVVVDSATLSSSTADLELFGHARGAFTGAHIERAGAFERADGGTLFLDELGELSPEVQRRLLRVTESGRVKRLGENAERSVNVRLVAATHAPLERMINDGTFRHDLLYRLAVMELWLAPLRERGRDVLLLGRFIAEEVRPGDPRAVEQVERELESRAGYTWPGNVRELRSFVRRVLLLGSGEGAPTPPGDAPRHVRVDMPFSEARDAWLRAFERAYMSQLLDETGGNVRAAAERAGLGRSRFYEVLARSGVRGRKPNGGDDGG